MVKKVVWVNHYLRLTIVQYCLNKQYSLDKTVIVDLPAQSHKAVSKWIEKNKLIENSKSHGWGKVLQMVCL